MQKNCGLILCGCFVFLVAIHVTWATPIYVQTLEGFRPIAEVEDPEVLAQLAQSLLKARHGEINAKRTLDLGLTRGFAGREFTKHAKGFNSAIASAGPGKRKRTEDALDYQPGFEVTAYGPEWYPGRN